MWLDRWIVFCRLKWLALVTIGLCTTFAFAFDATATGHRGSNGPGGVVIPYQPPTDGNFGGYLWGTVNVNGQPVENAVVTLSYNGQSITATTLLVREIEPFPIYMFGSRPRTELSATLGVTLTLTAAYPGVEFAPLAVRWVPQANDELEVSFGGPPPQPTPIPPSEVTATLPLTSVVTSHLLDAGPGNTCTVVNGAVWCWGQNDFYGQLGNGTLTNRNTPVRAGNINNARTVSAGSTHSCALLLNGKVQCWGWSYYGQLGYPPPGGSNISLLPSDMLGMENAIDVAVGHGSTCVLLAERRVKCLGYNGQGQLGLGSAITAQATSTYVMRDGASGSPLENVTALASSDLNYCAIVDGGMWCWGQYRGSPQTGPPSSAPAGTLPSEIIPAHNNVVAIATGYALSCAVKGNGELWCSDATSYPAHDPKPQRMDLPAGSQAVKVAVGHAFYCVLVRNGKVYCAGDNRFGQLGRSTPDSSTRPLLVQGLDADIVDLAAEWQHACVRTSQGKVQCWGSNSKGQLGDGSGPVTPRYRPTPIKVATPAGSKIETGGLHTCLRTPAGALQCWGANQYGQLGRGLTSLLEVTPTTISSLTSAVVDVAAGNEHTCAIKQNGASNEVWCWGRSEFGALGVNPPVLSSTLPIKVSGLEADQPTDLIAGDSHTCALLRGGGVKCWGYGMEKVPTTVSGFAASVVQIAAGVDHTCARLSTGYVQCWGVNNYRQLGVDILPGSLTPLTVTNLSGVTDLAATDFSSCAVANGALKCWGSFAPNLADGTVFTKGFTSTLPVTVFGLTSGVSKVQMGSDPLNRGGDFACVLRTTGAVQCLGANGVGNLGYEPSLAVGWNTPTPITVTALTSNVVDLHINPAGLFACAQLRDNSHRCWGDNTHGQLGIGVADLNPNPVTVPGLTPAQWTYMLYLVGDNDLSAYLDKISRQLDTLPVTTTLNIVVLYDGNQADDSYLWSTRKEAGYRAGLNKWKVRELSNNMGDPATLQRFVEWAHASYPAQHYYLAIANHGRATSGTGWDTQNGPFDGGTDRLTPAELRTALGNATYGGAWQLDILHFDSCLMGLLEMAYQVREYADFMIASQNLTAAFYPYDRYARLVLHNPAITPRQLAVGIADTYFNYDYLRINRQPRTIAVYDLSQIDPVMDALNSLASELITKTTTLTAAQAIQRQRTQTQKFDASPTGTPPALRYFTITEEDEYLDLYDLAQKLTTIPITAAHSLRDTLQPDPNGFVIFNRAESGVDQLVSSQRWNLSNSHGVAIYFPAAPGGFDYANYITHTLFAFTAASQWDEFLQAYFAALNSPPAPYIDPGVPPVLKPTKPITTHCQGVEPCLYGAVFSNTLPISGVVVTLAHANGTLSATTEVVPGNEAFPIYRLALNTLQIQPGDWVTLTVVAAQSVTQQRVRITPYNGEQQVDLVLAALTVIPATQSTPPHVTLLSAAVWPNQVGPASREVTFRAAAVASDNSPIVSYRWTSNLDGELGSTASFTLPVSQLRGGEHRLMVVAVNAARVESPAWALTLTVDPFDVIATGFTHIVDLEFDAAGNLYVLQLDKVVRIEREKLHTVVASASLRQPTAMTVGPDGWLYIANCGSCAPGEGQVVRAPVDSVSQ